MSVYKYNVRAQFALDSRPRAVLLCGNGLTLNLAHYLEMKLPARWSTLIPQPADTLLLPLPGSLLQPSPLWSGQHFPLLWKRWHELRREHPLASDEWLFNLLCADMNAALPLNLACDPFAFDICQGSLAYQLRMYLWMLIHTLSHECAPASARKPIGFWPLLGVVETLCRHFRLTVGTFNYDCLLEGAIDYLGFRPIAEPDAGFQRLIDAYRDQVVVLKPHGSHSFTNKGVALGPDDWNRGFTLRVEMNPPYNSVFPPRTIPTVPDIVPPGHGIRHSSNSWSDIPLAMRTAIKDADLLVVIGLSAGPADYAEIQQYLSHLRPTVSVVHAGISGDEEGPMAALLNTHTLDRQYFDLSNQQSIQQIQAALGNARLNTRITTDAHAFLRNLVGDKIYCDFKFDERLIAARDFEQGTK